MATDYVCNIADNATPMGLMYLTITSKCVINNSIAKLSYQIIKFKWLTMYVYIRIYIAKT